MTKKITLLTIILGVVQACTSDSLKRTTHEIMENIRQQECHKALSSECPERQSYADYLNDIEELDRSK
jgi:hypothetical protein